MRTLAPSYVTKTQDTLESNASLARTVAEIKSVFFLLFKGKSFVNNFAKKTDCQNMRWPPKK